VPWKALPFAVPRARLAALALGLLAAVLSAAPAAAQQQTGFETSTQWRIEQPAKNHIKLIGDVEARRGDMTFQADVIESFTDTHQVIGTGHVVFTQGGAWIAAERVEFNTETQLGTFYDATGSSKLADQPKRSMQGGQEPDVLFYGKRIEKIGPKKYRITDGAFTTCVQPTPRWQLSSGTVVLNLDSYAYLKGAVMRAKGVPVLYLPLLYYPINDEDRATGFLMPSYGTSTYRGFTLSNAFFWAINRSHDATFLYDWFAKRGQGLGAEYRYAGPGGSGGHAKFYNLREHDSTETDADGVATVVPGGSSYEVEGTLNQPLGGSWSLRSNFDYFTDIEAHQTYHTNIYDSSRSQRNVSAGIGGAVAQFNVNANYRISEYFSGGSANTTVVGGTPQLQFTRGEQPLFGSPIYFALDGEYVDLRREYHKTTGLTHTNTKRVDVMPTIRFPFTTLQWLTVNTSLSYRETWWSRSREPDTKALLDADAWRGYVQFSARAVGPVLNRVFSTPNNGYAERWKHTVEPYVDFQRVSKVENFDEIIQNDSTDSIVGGTTRIGYGLTNRLLAKRRGGEGPSSPREVVTVGISQTYYTDSRASQYDYNYSTSYSGLPPSNFSPISLAARVSPTQQINGTFRMEYDHQARAIRSLTGGGQFALSNWLNVLGAYSQRRVKDYANSDANETRYKVDNSLNLATTLRTPGNRVGGTYTLSYDIDRSTLLTSRIIGYYNAQCCGFAVEYQTVTFPSYSSYPVKQDNRFNFSFTLAGLGTFSNFFGALGGGSGQY